MKNIKITSRFKKFELRFSNSFWTHQTMKCKYPDSEFQKSANIFPRCIGCVVFCFELSQSERRTSTEETTYQNKKNDSSSSSVFARCLQNEKEYTRSVNNTTFSSTIIPMRAWSSRYLCFSMLLLSLLLLVHCLWGSQYSYAETKILRFYFVIVLITKRYVCMYSGIRWTYFPHPSLKTKKKEKRTDT